MSDTFPVVIRAKVFNGCKDIKEINGMLVGNKNDGIELQTIVLESDPQGIFKETTITPTMLDSRTFTIEDDDGDTYARVQSYSTYTINRDHILCTESQRIDGRLQRGDTTDMAHTDFRRKFASAYNAMHEYVKSFPLAEQGRFKVGQAVE